MGFSLREIKTLLRFRENPQKAKPGVRKMAYQKLEEIDAQLREIRTLKTELELLINLCHSTDDGCPILERLDNGDGNRVER
ncbi:MAG: MerR family DNA-binding protein [Woeseia sp.]